MSSNINNINISTLTKLEYKQLQEKASKANSFIRLALGDGPLLQTRFISNLYTIQNTLKNLYESKGFSFKFLLSKELISTTLDLYKGNLELYL